jgi:diacylglycerol kinase family enzyme
MAYLLISNLVVLVVAVAALLAATLAGWTALIRRGARRVVSLCVAVIALAAALVLLGPTTIAGMAIVVSLTIASATAARAAIGRHRPLTPAEGLPPGVVKVGPAAQPVLLLNPLSGDGTVKQSGLAARARRRGIRTVSLRAGDDLRQVAERETAAGATVIGIAGGDGSQALVADVARRHDIAFVCIPAGTYNHLAQDLGIDRSDLIGALDAFGNAVERRIDLGLVNGRVFVNNASMGVYAMIVQSAEYRATKVATAAEMLPDLIGADATPFDLSFAGPQEDRFDSADLLLVSNNPYAVMTPVGLGSRPRLDTGELGILAIRARNDATASAAGVDPEPESQPAKSIIPTQAMSVRNAVLSWTVPTFRVDSSTTVTIGVDGEAVQLQPPLEFSMLRQALRVRLPSSTVVPTLLGRTPGIRHTVAALLRIVANRPAWP